MDILFIIFIAIYFLILAILAVFGMHRYYIAYLYYRHKNTRYTNPPAFEEIKDLPFVTIQLPIYNEKYVLPRLVKAVCGIEYPKDKLEIQVLDDSTDETTESARNIVKAYASKGYPIVFIHRTNREGYKAGALHEGLQVAKGELVAIFDADFVPNSDFLKRLVPHFVSSPKVGMVQARWGHINPDYSLLTKAQSIFLDGHFVIEHTGRHRSGRFFNFNGTAGIWRKACIEDAGGWQHDTLTEDLDLSYRAQMKGWQFIFDPDLVVPAELPVEANAFKAQQHRWSKGSIQTAKKLVPKIIFAKIPWKAKVEALFHLTNNFAYLLMIVLSLLMPFSIYFRYQLGWMHSFYIDLPLFFSATFSVTFFYTCAQREAYPDWKARLKYIPFNLALGIGLSVNNAKAVLEAIFNHQTEFKRTPKYAIEKKTDQWKNKKYTNSFNWITFVELFLGVYFSLSLSYVIEQQIYVSIPFMILFQIGYFYMAFMGLFQSRTLMALAPNQN
ncbi:MAG: glycosyltransferase family 2 protein [Deltaproteobacteria bacterium]|nr:glycosyltransferase family 2 protein [Deltaproteobacteria bacterium]